MPVRLCSEANRGASVDHLSHNHDNRVDSFQNHPGKCLSHDISRVVAGFSQSQYYVVSRCLDKSPRALQTVFTPHFTVTGKWCHYTHHTYSSSSVCGIHGKSSLRGMLTEALILRFPPSHRPEHTRA
uniref:Uncharacterized protein n=1 Tax=Myotis myotis TaxID=51298 RepID=A0A7J7VZ51_MYOMY|nr:hypothetical protein mMyoMyo1_012266 [Myotis myotis]